MPFAVERLHRVTALVLLAFAALAAPTAPLAAQTLPTKLSDSTFWKMVTDISESNGYFRSDNFVALQGMVWVG
jgi:hypothetical protein